MNDNKDKKEEPEERAKESKSPAAREAAKAAFEEHSKKSSDTMYYWIVIIGFIIMCVACVIYVFREWRESPNLVAAIDMKDIEAHNAKNTLFKRGSNKLFAVFSCRDHK